MITCPLCPGARFASVQMLLKHVRMTHSDHASFSIQCSLQGCKRTFRTLSTYLGHVYSHHDCGVLDAYEPDDAPGGSGQGNDDTFDGGEGGFDDSTMRADGTTGGEIVQPYEAVMQRAAATWILKIREGHRIPLSVMDGIISDLQSLLQVRDRHIILIKFPIILFVNSLNITHYSLVFTLFCHFQYSSLPLI